ncbi:MAG TPA: GTP 3',8-cyclase MoaA [candidate division Zixibacteria bacterium]|nr:GTP 3',8-cyclase MoaA [candidate division Zixibacteria bacterium]
MVLKDEYGRPLLNLRVAITGKCNLRCSYCHGEGQERLDKNLTKEMRADEIAHIVGVAVGLGISRVKLTGGEPLARSDVVDIVAGISSIPGITDISMTTNGTLLAPLAKRLHESGLQRVNISLPTLDRQVYHDLTGGRAEDVLGGVKAAVDVGFSPVKLNTLILKGTNDIHVPEMIEFAAQTGTVLQLIELEPINMTNEYYSRKHKTLDEYEKMLKQKAVKIETRAYMQNRHIYYLPRVQVEIIRPIENTEFCLHCTRLRVTSDGKLKPCLMRNDNLTDILTTMRNGASDEELARLFKLANQERRPYQTSPYLLQN